MLKKITLIFLSLTFLFTTVFAPIANAQESQPWYMTDFKQWYTKVYDTTVSPPQEIFGERYTAAQVQWIFYSIPAMFFNFFTGLGGGDEDAVLCIMNRDFSDCISATTDTVEFVWEIFVADSGTQDGPFYATIFSKNRSFSGVNYVRQKIAGARIVPEAQAQGFGFSALGPVQNAWRIFRDISYGFFVIIIIVMAFMIMFRFKISPQTVITVQSAIPKVVLALIFVTFSYAIAGFLIDLVYVVIGILSYVVVETGLFQGLSGDAKSWNDIFSLLTDGPASLGVLGWIGFYWINFAFGNLIGWFSTFSPAGILGGIVGIVLGFIAFIISFITILVLLWWCIKIILMLLKAYIMLLINVVFAPLIITVGVLSPRGGIGSWIRNILSNLAVFPLTGVLFILAFYFVRANWGGILGGNLFEEVHFEEVWYPPLLWGSPTSKINPLPLLFTYASFGIIGLIPKAGEMVKAMVEGKPFAYGAAIGEAMGTPWAWTRAATWDSLAGREIREEIGEMNLLPILRGIKRAYGHDRFRRFAEGWPGRMIVPQKPIVSKRIELLEKKADT